MQYNGAAIIAMAGKDCVAIASDKRYGIRNQTVGCEMQKAFQVNDRTLVGLTGLATDQQTLEQLGLPRMLSQGVPRHICQPKLIEKFREMPERPEMVVEIYRGIRRGSTGKLLGNL